jgi:hypothetical protein
MDVAFSVVSHTVALPAPRGYDERRAARGGNESGAHTVWRIGRLLAVVLGMEEHVGADDPAGVAMGDPAADLGQVAVDDEAIDGKADGQAVGLVVEAGEASGGSVGLPQGSEVESPLAPLTMSTVWPVVTCASTG